MGLHADLFRSGTSALQLAQALGMAWKKAVTVLRSASMVSEVSFSARERPSEQDASRWELCRACSAALSSSSAAAQAWTSACSPGSSPSPSSSMGSAPGEGPLRCDSLHRTSCVGILG